MMRLLTGLLLATQVFGFLCEAEELSKYDFSKIKGVHTVSQSKDTPPSKTEVTWNIGICEAIKDIEECKDSDLCGLTKITLDLKTYVSEIIKVDAKDKVKFKAFKNSGDSNDESGMLITYDTFKWGEQDVNAELKFICPQKDDSGEGLDEFKLSSWDGKKLKLAMKTKSACASKKKTHKSEPVDNGESWGWFTWIFIFFVLFLSIYIIGGAWFQYNKGNSIDFQTALKEVIENFIEVVKGLPIFIREIIERFTGNSSRGEYSAV